MSLPIKLGNDQQTERISVHIPSIVKWNGNKGAPFSSPKAYDGQTNLGSENIYWFHFNDDDFQSTNLQRANYLSLGKTTDFPPCPNSLLCQILGQQTNLEIDLMGGILN